MKKLIAVLIGLLLIPVASLGQGKPSAIEIVPGSTINLVAREARIPITIKNATTENADVVLKGVATTFRIDVLDFVEASVPANASVVVELPVRAIANGPTQLKLWLVQDGAMLNDFVLIDVNINYDIELFIIVSFGAVLLVLVSVGGLRTFRKLRRSKSLE